MSTNIRGTFEFRHSGVGSGYPAGDPWACPHLVALAGARFGRGQLMGRPEGMAV